MTLSFDFEKSILDFDRAGAMSTSLALLEGFRRLSDPTRRSLRLCTVSATALVQPGSESQRGQRTDFLGGKDSEINT